MTAAGTGAVRRFGPPATRAPRRLFCLPHAGGGAGLFRDWAAALGPDVDVVPLQYPGRENRMGEPLVDAMPDLVAHLADTLSGAVAGEAGLLDRPWAVFGHSMGAAVAYEVVLELRRRGHGEPSHVVASAREAPAVARGGTVHQRDDDGLADALSRLGGTAGEVLAHPELRELLLPVVRNDYRLIEHYRPSVASPLRAPVTVVRGDVDDEVDAAEGERWRETTTGPFAHHVLPGDHFYLLACPHRLHALVRACLLPTPDGSETR